MMTSPQTCCVVSAIALIGAPIAAMWGGFEANYLLLGLTLFLMGALGLFAGMKKLAKE
jgi:hypothetical protein